MAVVPHMRDLAVADMGGCPASAEVPASTDPTSRMEFK